MAQALHLNAHDTVLEIGTGSGYAAAVLSRIVAHVYTIEYFPRLAQLAQERYKKRGYTNISVLTGDGAQGWQEHAPFNGISVTAGATVIPQKLLAQLAPGGRLVMPVGPSVSHEELISVTKSHNNTLTYESFGPVRFVPLL